ncbi:TAXI family TRAP transporter solute-binding subunit [Leucobacter celer]|uniref:TAXI family TRAP transporter solute-binding subunit n=1 Tax=Leucobacter celer TaxID=668625 RepID=UPI0006A77201|nr:TAXI family TRAP transporter solute-binding subunit [Leucobacter celer]
MSGITRRHALIGLASGALLSLAGCTRPPATALAMACGQPGALYIQFGELLRDALRARGTALVDLVETGGSADNVALLGEGAVDLAISLADTAEESVAEAGGAGDAGIVALGRVYQNYLQCLVRADGPVADLAGLAGRPVSIGAAGSGTSRTARRVLAAMGMNGGGNEPVLHEHLLTDGLHALASGGVDALFWSGGIPTPEIAGLARETPLELLDLTVAMPLLDEAYPDQYLATRVPAGVYGIRRPAPTIGIPNLLLAQTTLSDAAARALVDVLIDDAHALVPEGTVGLQFLTPAGLIDTGTIPLHPAARQRYRERYG